METFYALLTLYEGNPPVTGGFPSQTPVRRSFGVFSSAPEQTVEHRSPVDSPHKRQWGVALVFFFICAWTNGWANNQDAGDSRRHRAHCNITVMDEIRFPAIHCIAIESVYALAHATTAQLQSDQMNSIEFE